MYASREGALVYSMIRTQATSTATAVAKHRRDQRSLEAAANLQAQRWKKRQAGKHSKWT
jgi:hypothetical protein